MEGNNDEGSSKDKAFLPGYPTLESYTQDLLRTMSAAIKSSNSLPCDRKEDWDYYTTFKSFRDVTKAQQVNKKRDHSLLVCCEPPCFFVRTFYQVPL